MPILGRWTPPPLNSKELTKAELLRLAGQLAEAERQGYVRRKAWLCGRWQYVSRQLSRQGRK